MLIGSTEAYSGKSATIFGITHQLKEKGLAIAYGKPLETFVDGKKPEKVGEDVEFMTSSLDLSQSQVRSPLLSLDQETISKRLQGEDKTDYAQALQEYAQQLEGDLVLLEGGATLGEGSLFNLSVAQIAEVVDASILLVAPYCSLLLVESLLSAKQLLGDRTLGVLINDVPPEQIESVQTLIKPFLEEQGIAVLGILPRNKLLRSISVREISKRLGAKVLCRPDRLDLMVESMAIGAMNVNSALEYFRQRENMAVVTGGDRTDLQLAALETSTHCLILTGHMPPQPLILSRAEDLEIPILSVDLDTLTTVEIVDQAFGKVSLQEPIKVQCIQNLIKQYFDLDRLMDKLGLESAVTA
ncbi:MAG: phosphotransacetylase family protein [Moorea sp. SIO2B7]|nr:phosphotransacetylase family protein [Moorena sp. SIO2B7]